MMRPSAKIDVGAAEGRPEFRWVTEPQRRRRSASQDRGRHGACPEPADGRTARQKVRERLAARG